MLPMHQQHQQVWPSQQPSAQQPQWPAQHQQHQQQQQQQHQQQQQQHHHQQQQQQPYYPQPHQQHLQPPPQDSYAWPSHPQHHDYRPPHQSVPPQPQAYPSQPLRPYSPREEWARTAYNGQYQQQAASLPPAPAEPTAPPPQAQGFVASAAGAAAGGGGGAVSAPPPTHSAPAHNNDAYYSSNAEPLQAAQSAASTPAPDFSSQRHQQQQGREGGVGAGRDLRRLQARNWAQVKQEAHAAEGEQSPQLPLRRSSLLCAPPSESTEGRYREFAAPPPRAALLSPLQSPRAPTPQYTEGPPSAFSASPVRAAPATGTELSPPAAPQAATTAAAQAPQQNAATAQASGEARSGGAQQRRSRSPASQLSSLQDEPHRAQRPTRDDRSRDSGGGGGGGYGGGSTHRTLQHRSDASHEWRSPQGRRWDAPSSRDDHRYTDWRDWRDRRSGGGGSGGGGGGDWRNGSGDRSHTARADDVRRSGHSTGGGSSGRRSSSRDRRDSGKDYGAEGGRGGAATSDGWRSSGVDRLRGSVQQSEHRGEGASRSGSGDNGRGSDHIRASSSRDKHIEYRGSEGSGGGAGSVAGGGDLRSPGTGPLQNGDSRNVSRSSVSECGRGGGGTQPGSRDRSSERGSAFGGGGSGAGRSEGRHGSLQRHDVRASSSAADSSLRPASHAASDIRSPHRNGGGGGGGGGGSGASGGDVDRRGRAADASRRPMAINRGAGRAPHRDLGVAAAAAAAAAAATARAAPGALDEGHGRGGIGPQLWSHSALGPLHLREAFGKTLVHDILQVSITRCDPRALGLLPLLCIQASGSRKPLRQIVMDLQSQDSGQPQNGTTPTIKRKRDTGGGGGGGSGGGGSSSGAAHGADGGAGQSGARTRQWHVGVALSCGLPKETSMCKVATELELVVNHMDLPGGAWDQHIDGGDPSTDLSVLIATAIRTARAGSGLDLAGCLKWVVLCQIERADSTMVIFLVDAAKARAVKEEIKADLRSLRTVALTCAVSSDVMEYRSLSAQCRVALWQVLETVARDMAYTLLHFTEAAAAAAAARRSGDGDEETDEEDDTAQRGPELNSDDRERLHAAAAFFGAPRARDLCTIFMSLGPALSEQRAAQLAELCAGRIAEFAHARSGGSGGGGRRSMNG